MVNHCAVESDLAKPVLLVQFAELFHYEEEIPEELLTKDYIVASVSKSVERTMTAFAALDQAGLLPGKERQELFSYLWSCEPEYGRRDDGVFVLRMIELRLKNKQAAVTAEGENSDGFVCSR